MAIAISVGKAFEESIAWGVTLIKVDLSLPPFEYEPKYLVYLGNSVNEFIAMIEKYGGSDTLENDKCFAIMFNNEPDIDKVEDYKPVLRKYPNSHRVLNKQCWIGFVPECEHSTVVQQCLDNLFHHPYYKI